MKTIEFTEESYHRLLRLKSIMSCARNTTFDDDEVVMMLVDREILRVIGTLDVV